jgi:uncharacterized surface protein with fasciclin (FAS1) repeats
MSTLRHRSVTIFAPTNQAFQRYQGNRTNVLYHMTTVATHLEHLPATVASDLDGNPPLFITRKKRDNHEDIFVNNALILKSRSNVALQNESKKKQVSAHFLIHSRRHMVLNQLLLTESFTAGEMHEGNILSFVFSAGKVLLVCFQNAKLCLYGNE